MKLSRTRFVIIFLISALVFQFVSNSLLGPEVRLFPVNGDFFPGADSSIAWKRTLAAILYPVKIILIGPLPALFNNPDPDAPPPFFLIAFVTYWTAMALVIHYLLSKLFIRKKSNF